MPFPFSVWLICIISSFPAKKKRSGKNNTEIVPDNGSYPVRINRRFLGIRIDITYILKKTAEHSAVFLYDNFYSFNL